MPTVSSSFEDADVSSLSLIPWPNHILPGEGRFSLEGPLALCADNDAHDEASLLADQLELASGVSLHLTTKEGAGRRIELFLASAHEAYEPQGYSLKVTADVVRLVAADSAGLFYACQTLLQLLPARPEAGGPPLSLPCVEIRDCPRFHWRGVMLDVARYFMPVAFVKKFIDALALHKINVLQLHLNDDQGWRIEIKKYPKLTSVGSHRSQTLVGQALYSPIDCDFDPSLQVFDGIPHAGHYSQEEARDIVAYAAARHITVVPEIEMPGHAQAAIAAYPEFGCTSVPVDVSPRWGVHDTLYLPSEETFGFLEDVLTEVMEIFPANCIHIGGDEAVKRQWVESEFCQNLKRGLGLADEEQLQSYFINRIGKFLASRGRTLVGWDEILQVGLDDDAVVMSWRGESCGIKAAQLGHDVVMAPNQYTYFDYYQSEDRTSEPLAMSGVATLKTVYDYNPVPAELDVRLSHHVLGVQGQLWTEYIPHSDQAEYMAFPRVSALAEVAWTQSNFKSYSNFVERLPVHLNRLKAMNVRYRPLDAV